MHVELSQQERDLLAQLVYSAVREIGTEIRHTTSPAATKTISNNAAASCKDCAIS